MPKTTQTQTNNYIAEIKNFSKEMEKEHRVLGLKMRELIDEIKSFAIKSSTIARMKNQRSKK